MPTAIKPTPKQLSYLRQLADRTGQTFTYPHSRLEASREIDRLKHAKHSSRAERYHERKAIADQIATGPQDAARVREHEIHGRGSTATWTQNRDQTPPTVENPGPAPKRPAVGTRTELARCRAGRQERIVYGQRVDGVVRVTDRPAREGGRAYLVDRDLDSKAELDALVADYIAQARRLGACPMSATAVARLLDGTPVGR